MSVGTYYYKNWIVYLLFYLACLRIVIVPPTPIKVNAPIIELIKIINVVSTITPQFFNIIS